MGLLRSYRPPSKFQNRMPEDSPVVDQKRHPVRRASCASTELHTRKNGLPKAPSIGAMLRLTGYRYARCTRRAKVPPTRSLNRTVTALRR